MVQSRSFTKVIKIIFYNYLLTSFAKDDQAILKGISSQDGRTSLEIFNASLMDSGNYSCRITNSFGTAQMYFYVKVRATPMETWLIIVITSAICFSAATLIGLICFYSKKIKKIKVVKRFKAKLLII